jgi:hypothetical protein
MRAIDLARPRTQKMAKEKMVRLTSPWTRGTLLLFLVGIDVVG